MTWIVVVGSTLVMMLWIVVYSFFPSSDFVDEVSILFSTISFWGAVIVSCLICLGAFILSGFALALSDTYPSSEIRSQVLDLDVFSVG